MMKCPECGCENTIHANYCHQCGKPFRKKKKKQAYDRTFYGKLDKLEEAAGWLTLKRITENVIFRVGVLLIIAALGILSVIRNGAHMKLQNSPYYTCEYNTALEEYYIYTDDEAVQLALYVPRSEGTLTVSAYQETDLLKETTYDAGESITLVRDGSWYRLKADYGDGSEEIRIHLFSGKK